MEVCAGNAHSVLPGGSQLVAVICHYFLSHFPIIVVPPPLNLISDFFGIIWRYLMRFIPVSYKPCSQIVTFYLNMADKSMQFKFWSPQSFVTLHETELAASL